MSGGETSAALSAALSPPAAVITKCNKNKIPTLRVMGKVAQLSTSPQDGASLKRAPACLGIGVPLAPHPSVGPTSIHWDPRVRGPSEQTAA